MNYSEKFVRQKNIQKTHQHVFPWTLRSRDCLLSSSPLRISFCLFSIHCHELLAMVSENRGKYVYSIFPGSRRYDRSLSFFLLGLPWWLRGSRVPAMQETSFYRSKTS